tara:strand:- start:34872 stop:36272 length:1401 start_codon:yes stop_codon:yes gene_type:complete
MSDPSKTTPAVDAMREDWAVVDPLMGGTKAMRKAGTALLPKWPKEEDDSYKARLKLSTLYPAYSETVGNMTGRVFAEPITFGEEVPEQIKELCDNIDRQGNNLQVWAQDLFSKGLSNGLCHVLVDYPRAEGIKTKADEKAAGVRPYAVIIRPEQVLGWKAEGNSGEQMLTMFRYIESVEEADPDNEFLTKPVTQVRVLEPGKWTVYRQKEEGGKKTWFVHDKGVTSLSIIPLATLYTKRTGFMTATPPLMELAHLNVKHWQSQSDQDNILHIARVPLLVAINAGDVQSDDGTTKPWSMTIGTSQATSMGPDGDLKYVEHTGKAIEAGRVSLLDLQDQMRVAGAKLLERDSTGTKTATQADEEAAQDNSPLETMAGRLEDCIDQVFQLFAMWLGESSGGNVKVNGNFDADFYPEVTLPFLNSMANGGRLSSETLFNEAKRRRVISDDLNWDEERERIESQGPSLGAL